LQKKKIQKTRSAASARFRPGATGACESPLWAFVGPPRVLNEDDAPEIHWVAAESLDAALRYVRRRFDDFTIAEARLVGVIPVLSGSPLD
jgi:hypothetical protein